MAQKDEQLPKKEMHPEAWKRHVSDIRERKLPIPTIDEILEQEECDRERRVKAYSLSRTYGVD